MVAILELQVKLMFDWTECPAHRRSIDGCCVFGGGSVESWKSKKLSLVTRSNTKLGSLCARQLNTAIDEWEVMRLVFPE